MLQEHLGFSVPEPLLSNAWVEGLNVKSLAAFCTFEIYQRFANAAIQSQPLAHPNPEVFEDLLEACGFHWMAIRNPRSLASRPKVRAPLRRPGALTGLTEVRDHGLKGQDISMAHDNDRLANYDQAVKANFDQIEDLLRCLF